MRITSCPESGRVTIEYVDALGAPRVRTFSTLNRDGASFVLELHADGCVTQPCERLYAFGRPLVSTRDGLPETIRREYRRMRAAERHLMTLAGAGRPSHDTAGASGHE